MGIPRGLLVRNTDSASPLRRREFTFNLMDDDGRSAVEPVQCDLGDVLLGFPEPDATNTHNVFVVDQLYVQNTADGGSAGTDLIQVDIFAGVGGTSMLSTEAILAWHTSAAAVSLASVGGAAANGVTHPVLKAAASCEVPAGTGLYMDLTIVNASTAEFGAINIIVSGYYKDEF